MGHGLRNHDDRCAPLLCVFYGRFSGLVIDPLVVPAHICLSIISILEYAQHHPVCFCLADTLPTLWGKRLDAHRQRIPLELTFGECEEFSADD